MGTNYMKPLNLFEYKKSQKRHKELEDLLIKLDLVADTLYDLIGYDGVWDTILSLEDVRVKYYVEFIEHDLILNGRKNVKKSNN